MSENLKMQFLGSELGEGESNEDSARFHVIPCPLEKTVSYGSGTALGPKALIEASWELVRSSVCEQGIFTQDSIDCSISQKECLRELHQRTKSLVIQNKVPITLGGEHSLTWAAVQGVGDALGEKIGILQFDAHADLRDCYMGEVHSHASVMNLLVKEGHSLASFGVRALCEEERISRKDHSVFFIDGEELVRNDIRTVSLPKDFPKYVYLSFDLDGLDTSIMPAVGTPVPGGLGFYQAIDLVESVLEGRKCVGMDIVELAPIENDLVSPYTAACLLQRFLSFV
jgi:agmatinase